ncbi:hypothetical protein NDK25_09485 [Niallia taxi]|nr:hypothetical protein [Niallia taxi]MDE5052486.1 hypothetical protein [Niallia taxi]
MRNQENNTDPSKGSNDPTSLISFFDFLILNINGINNVNVAKKLKEAFYGKKIDE